MTQKQSISAGEKDLWQRTYNGTSPTAYSIVLGDWQVDIYNEEFWENLQRTYQEFMEMGSPPIHLYHVLVEQNNRISLNIGSTKESNLPLAPLSRNTASRHCSCTAKT